MTAINPLRGSLTLRVTFAVSEQRRRAPHQDHSALLHAEEQATGGNVPDGTVLAENLSPEVDNCPSVPWSCLFILGPDGSSVEKWDQPSHDSRKDSNW